LIAVIFVQFIAVRSMLHIYKCLYGQCVPEAVWTVGRTQKLLPLPGFEPGQSIQYRSRSNINICKIKTDINK